MPVLGPWVFNDEVFGSLRSLVLGWHPPQHPPKSLQKISKGNRKTFARRNLIDEIWREILSKPSELVGGSYKGSTVKP